MHECDSTFVAECMLQHKCCCACSIHTGCSRENVLHDLALSSMSWSSVECLIYTDVPERDLRDLYSQVQKNTGPKPTQHALRKLKLTMNATIRRDIIT